MSDRTRITLITGASRGIGLASARYLSSLGHMVIGIARTLPIDKFPGIFVQADLSSKENAREIFAGLSEQYAINGLINNVAIVKPERIEDVDIDTLSDVIDLNVRSAVQATQATLPTMKTQQFGRIVNVSSISALGANRRTAYGGAKACLISFSRTWALELATCGITVNTIAPGPTETVLFRENNPLGSINERYKIDQIPMKRLADVDEIAFAIGFFMSEQASFVTGQTLFVDGGISVGRYTI